MDTSLLALLDHGALSGDLAPLPGTEGVPDLSAEELLNFVNDVFPFDGDLASPDNEPPSAAVSAADLALVAIATPAAAETPAEQEEEEEEEEEEEVVGRKRRREGALPVAKQRRRDEYSAEPIGSLANVFYFETHKTPGDFVDMFYLLFGIPYDHTIVALNKAPFRYRGSLTEIEKFSRVVLTNFGRLEGKYTLFMQTRDAILDTATPTEVRASERPVCCARLIPDLSKMPDLLAHLGGSKNDIYSWMSWISLAFMNAKTEKDIAAVVYYVLLAGNLLGSLFSAISYNAARNNDTTLKTLSICLRRLTGRPQSSVLEFAFRLCWAVQIFCQGILPVAVDRLYDPTRYRRGTRFTKMVQRVGWAFEFGKSGEQPRFEDPSLCGRLCMVAWELRSLSNKLRHQISRMDMYVDGGAPAPIMDLFPAPFDLSRKPVDCRVSH